MAHPSHILHYTALVTLRLNPFYSNVFLTESGVVFDTTNIVIIYSFDPEFSGQPRQEAHWQAVGEVPVRAVVNVP